MTNGHSLRTGLADLLLVAVTVLAALGWVFSRYSLEGLAPLLFMGLRFFASAGILAACDWRSLASLDRGQWRRAVVTGVLLGVQVALWVMGLHHAEHMGVGAFLVSLGVMLVPVVGRLFFSVRTRLYVWLANGVALAGLGLLLLGNDLRLQTSDWYFLATALLFAIYFNVNGRYAARIPALPLTAVQMLVAGAITLGASLGLETWSFSGLPSVMGWFLASVVISTALRFYLLVRAQSHASEAHAAIIMTLEPMWVVLLGALWFGETMSGVQIGGCALIFASLMLCALGNIRTRRARTRATIGTCTETPGVLRLRGTQDGDTRA